MFGGRLAGDMMTNPDMPESEIQERVKLYFDAMRDCALSFAAWQFQARMQ